MDGGKFTAYGLFVPTEGTNTRHLIPSIMLVMALLLLGIPLSFAGTSSAKAARPVFQKAQSQTFVLRSAETKASSRKAPETFAIGFDGVACWVADAASSVQSGWILVREETGFGIAATCGFRGRAPPAAEKVFVLAAASSIPSPDSLAIAGELFPPTL